MVFRDRSVSLHPRLSLLLELSQAPCNCSHGHPSRAPSASSPPSQQWPSWSFELAIVLAATSRGCRGKEPLVLAFVLTRASSPGIGLRQTSPSGQLRPSPGPASATTRRASSLAFERTQPQLEPSPLAHFRTTPTVGRHCFGRRSNSGGPADVDAWGPPPERLPVGPSISVDHVDLVNVVTVQPWWMTCGPSLLNLV
jgi:hypothetical protein